MIQVMTLPVTQTMTQVMTLPVTQTMTQVMTLLVTQTMTQVTTLLVTQTMTQVTTYYTLTGYTWELQLLLWLPPAFLGDIVGGGGQRWIRSWSATDGSV